MKFAVPTLEDKVKRSRVAEVAVPLNQGIVRLDDLERVGTTTPGSHSEDVRGGCK